MKKHIINIIFVVLCLGILTTGVYSACLSNVALTGTITIIGQLPNTYQAVEYIQSSGSAYINTGITPNQDTSVIVDFQYTTNNKVAFVLGARVSTSSTGYTVSSGSGSQLISAYNNSGNRGLANFDTNRHTVIMNKNQVYIDNALKHETTYAAFECTGNMFLFACNQKTSSGNIDTPYLISTCRIYSCKIYDNDTLVRNFIPCYQKNTNKPGMYDTITGDFYQNVATTGEDFIFPTE